MIGLNIKELFYILVCLLPGYVFEHIVRYRIPHKKSTGLEYFLNLLWHSLILNILILVLVGFLLKINYFLVIVEKYMIYFINGEMNNYYFAQGICAYVMVVIILSYLSATLFVRYVTKNEKAKDKLPVFTRIINEASKDDILFLKMILKNNEIYSGQLRYYPGEYDMLASAKFHVYLEEVYQLKNDNWEKLKSHGLLLDISDVVTLEYDIVKIKK